ncbi:MAG: carboxyl transferase [Lachnospiraceae bacterium]|nr:carboxyl transferase [Lachnospiraceae bacterium]
MSNIPTSSAGRRIAALLDDNSFVEIGAAVTARATDFNLNAQDTPSDGVITGYGLIGGEPVYVYSQDASVLGGSIGEMHAKKITNLYNLAIKVGAPVIGLIDSTGIRLQEATDALMSLGSIYKKMSLASGVIPQIVGIFGSCGGGLATCAALADFVFIEETKGKLFVNSPNAIKGNTEEKNDTSCAAFAANQSGNADFVGDEATVIAQIRALSAILPASNRVINDADGTDDLNRLIPDLKGNIDDAAIALSQIADAGTYLELKKDWAQDMVTAFIKLDGITVGAVANRTVVYDENGKAAEFDGSLSVRGARKAAAFVRFCDAFDIPVLTLTNVSGYEASVCAERHLAQASAELAYAFAESTVPRVNVITRKAFGSAFVAMNSKSLGADVTFAWKDAKIGTMDSNLAAKIMFEGQGSETISEKAAEYEKLQGSAESAARRGYVDTVIDPSETRKYVIGAFEMLYTKTEEHYDKKHGAL